MEWSGRGERVFLVSALVGKETSWTQLGLTASSLSASPARPPDWFHPNASKYWVDEFGRFFSPEGGIDVRKEPCSADAGSDSNLFA